MIDSVALRDKALAEIVNEALRAPVALVKPPKKMPAVILTEVGSKFYNYVEVTASARILGVFDGQKIGLGDLVDLLTEELQEACVGLA